MINNLTLKVYSKGEEIPFTILKQVKELENEKISEYFTDPYTFDVGIVTDDTDLVLGVGIIRVVAEFKMQLLHSLNDLDKAVIIRDLMNEAISRRPCGEVLVMVTQGGEPYTKFLQKHFDFQIIEGTPLKWEA